MNPRAMASPVPTSPSSPHAWIRDIQSISQADDRRTTQDIVWSCIATIFACTWLAIHPNLPDPRHSKWSQFKWRIFLMVLTIFAPEFILIWALRQRLGAYSIMKEYNSTVCGNEGKQNHWFHFLRAWFRDPPPPSERQEWTLAHGFYVQMGGLLIQESEADWPIRVLTLPELLDLIKSDLIDPPIIPEDELCDKSKVDLFAKLFVLCQTTGFIIQCIVRWIAKLPLAEFEIIAFSFAVLNIFTYALWLGKPQNVSVGTRIQMKAHPKHFLHQDYTMSTSAAVNEVDITDAPQSTPDINYPLPLGDQKLEREDDLFNHDLESHCREHLRQRQTEPSPASNRVQRVHGKRSSCSAMLSVLSRSLYLLARGVLRAELFTQFRQVVLGTTSNANGRSVISTQTVRRGRSTGTATIVSIVPGPLTVGTFFAYDPPGNDGKIRLIIFVVTSGALFGGLHLIPWKFTFPTKTELLLWRASALYMMLNPVLLSFPLALYALLLNRSSAFAHIRAAVIRWLRWATLPVRIITIAIPLYIFARLTIIVLALTTLRSLQPDVYKEISWSSYIPHL